MPAAKKAMVTAGLRWPPETDIYELQRHKRSQLTKLQVSKPENKMTRTVDMPMQPSGVHRLRLRGTSCKLHKGVVEIIVMHFRVKTFTYKNTTW